MIRWIVGSSLQSRVIVLAIAVLVMGVGIVRLPGTPVALYPEFDPPRVEIHTNALGLSAEEVEGLITVPLEADLLNGVSWVETIRSQSMPGLSVITLEFEDGTEVLRARQMVQERLTQVGGLPHVSKPPVMLNPLSSTSRVLHVGMRSNDLSLIDMSVIAQWTVMPRLMSLPGVANVSIYGQRNRQLQVQVDPEQLHSAGLTLDSIIETAGNAMWVSPLSYLDASTPGTGGFIDTPNQRLGIKHQLPIQTPGDLAQVTIAGSNLRLGDVTQVVENHQPLIGDAIIAGRPGLMLVVEKFPWANTVEVTESIESTLAAMKPGLSGVEIDTGIFHPATFVKQSLGNLWTAWIVGGVLALLALIALLFDWRTTVISVVAVSLSLFAAALVIHLFGVPMSTFLLAGLLLALVVAVDDAVVDVRHLAQRLKGTQTETDGSSPTRRIVDAVSESRLPLLYGTLTAVFAVAPLLMTGGALIVLMAIMPVFFVGGLPGAFGEPIVVAFLVAIAASFLVAITITPVLALLLLGKAPADKRASPILTRLTPLYERLLQKSVAAPRIGYIATGVVVVACAIIVPLLGQQVVPAFKDTNLLVEMDSLPGTSHPATSRMAMRLSSELRNIDGVREVGAHVGRALLSDQAVDVNLAELWINIDPEADYAEVTGEIRQVIDTYPGIDADSLTYPGKQLDAEQVNWLPSFSLLSSPEEEIKIRVYGHSYSILRGKAAEVAEAIKDIRDVEDVTVAHLIEEPVLEVELDLEKARAYGLKPGDVRRSEATLLSGLQVGNIFEEQKIFDVVVWGQPQIRDDVTTIRDLLIDTPGGGQVRLGEIARVEMKPHPSVIERDSVSRFLDVEVTVPRKMAVRVARQIEARIDDIKWPLEYHAEVLGDFQSRLDAQSRVAWFTLAAAVGVFLLFQACFNSWRMAIVAFIAMPVAMSGGIIAVALGGGVLSLGSLLGFFGVLAFAARNLTMLYRRYQAADQRQHGEVFPEDALRQGSLDHFGSTIITALVALLALAPFVFSGDIAGLEIANPIAVVVFGGVITTTLLNLLVMPNLYRVFGTRSVTEYGEDEVLQGSVSHEAR